MKIFHVITSLKIGGAESALFNFLQKSINDKNEHIIAYYYPGPNLEKIKQLGFKTYHIKGLFWKYDFLAYQKLKTIIKENNPDIIHSALWSANLFSKLVAESLGIPVICDLHSNFLYDGKIRRIIEKLTLLKADKYVAVSKSAKKGFLSAFEKQANKLEPKTVIIQNAIDITYEKKHKQTLTRKNLGFDSNDFIVGAVGRLEKIKSYDLLIKSFATVCNKIKKINSLNKHKVNYLKPIKLCIVGDGSQKNYLEKLVKNLGLKKNILFTGMRNNIHNFYPLFDCLAISSKSEGLSIVLLEALSFGLPIISTSQNYEGTFNVKKHDILVNNRNGLIVPPEDQNKLALAIKKLYLNPKIGKKMGKINKQLVKSTFSIEKLIHKYNSLYENLINN